MYHLAQLNIGRLRYPIDDPQISEFVENIDRINQLAERSPGFVWRLQDNSGNATDFHPFGDPQFIVNMSVWVSIDALKGFTYQSGHVEIMRKRKQWFEKHSGPFMVLWWVPVGHIPTIEMAKERLSHLREKGESSEAFTFREVFDPPILT